MALSLCVCAYVCRCRLSLSLCLSQRHTRSTPISLCFVSPHPGPLSNLVRSLMPITPGRTASCPVPACFVLSTTILPFFRLVRANPLGQSTTLCKITSLNNSYVKPSYAATLSVIFYDSECQSIRKCRIIGGEMGSECMFAQTCLFTRKRAEQKRFAC